MPSVPQKYPRPPTLFAQHLHAGQHRRVAGGAAVDRPPYCGLSSRGIHRDRARMAEWAISESVAERAWNEYHR